MAGPVTNKQLPQLFLKPLWVSQALAKVELISADGCVFKAKRPGAQGQAVAELACGPNDERLQSNKRPACWAWLKDRAWASLAETSGSVRPSAASGHWMRRVGSFQWTAASDSAA